VAPVETSTAAEARPARRRASLVHCRDAADERIHLHRVPRPNDALRTGDGFGLSPLRHPSVWPARVDSRRGQLCGGGGRQEQGAGDGRLLRVGVLSR